MRKTVFLFTLLTLFFNNVVSAQFQDLVNARQDTTTLFARPGYDADPIRGSWTRKLTRKDGLWVLSLSDKKDVLREQISFEDEKMAVRKGPYSFYENGNLQQEGNYDRGYKLGEWKTYFPNKQLAEKANYKWDVLVDNYTSYWSSGKVRWEIFYVKGKQTGISKLFDAQGRLAYQEKRDADGKVLETTFFEEDGKTTTTDKIFQKPSYPGGQEAFYKYLARAIKYPKQAAENNKQGTVKLSFLIKPDGTIENIEVNESPDLELSKEAVRVISNTKPWIPGKEFGEPVAVHFNLPIKFNLTK